jgi:hypothetical protein
MQLFARLNGRSFRPPYVPPPALKFQELVALAADLSPSMEEHFRLPDYSVISRLDGLKRAAEFWLVQKRAASAHIQVAVVGFAYTVKLWRDWTPLSRLDEVLATVRALSNQGSSTNIADALEMALDRIAAFRTPPQTRRDAKVLLVTDGAGNVATHKHDALIRRACCQRVRLFTVAICNRRDNPTSYDRDLLFRMARETRGRFASAHNLHELQTALAASR